LEALTLFLSRTRISELCSKGEDSIIRPDTFREKNLQQASYDLRLGADSYIVGADVPVHLSPDKQSHLTIAPGQFALLMTCEVLNIPNDIICFISLRNSYKMQGLVNISGFHVDPSHKGKLVFAVNNVGPSDIRLRLDERTFTIFFARVEGDIGEPREAFGEELPLQYVQLLGGSSVTLTRLQKELEDLKTKVFMYAPLGIALLIALLLNLLKKS
jgi:dCTP deaminase